MGSNCLTCEWLDKPAETRRPVCIECSKRFVKNRKIQTSTNELSNKGQTIVSYDNPNPSYADDRKTVVKIDKNYLKALEPSSDGVARKIGRIASKTGASGEDVAMFMSERIKGFLCELSMLPDMQLLLFFSKVRGEKAHTFAKNHNLTDPAVNTLHWQLLNRSEVFGDFLTMTTGDVIGASGRKPRGAVRKKVTDRVKVRYSCASQMTMAL